MAFVDLLIHLFLRAEILEFLRALITGNQIGTSVEADEEHRPFGRKQLAFKT